MVSCSDALEEKEARTMARVKALLEMKRDERAFRKVQSKARSLLFIKHSKGVERFADLSAAATAR
jgi:hypothetical protein